jgi:acyl carrier protein
MPWSSDLWKPLLRSWFRKEHDDMNHVKTSSEVMEVVFTKAFEMACRALPADAKDKGKLNLGRDLGLDSLDSIQLCVALENHFKVDLEESTSWRTLQDIVDSIDSALASQGA